MTRVAERTNASTTGLLRVDTREWDDELIERLGFPAAVFPRLVDPGEVVGALRPEVAAELGAGARHPLEVVAVGSHDTASAVVAVPMRPESAAYISCGTWGLVGVELEHPVTSDAARAANFTNEGGVDGRVRFLHNVMGLWLLSESVRQWERDGEAVDLAELLAAAASVTAPVAVFDANDARFLAPGDMPARIAEWCREHDAPVPASQAEFARAIIESLAQAFADAVADAARLSGTAVETIHIVGGGALNELLCRRTADRVGAAGARRTGRGDRDRQRARAGPGAGLRRPRPRVAARARVGRVLAPPVRAARLTRSAGDQECASSCRPMTIAPSSTSASRRAAAPTTRGRCGAPPRSR